MEFFSQSYYRSRNQVAFQTKNLFTCVSVFTHSLARRKTTCQIVYTNKTDGNEGCNGWASTNLQECRDLCIRNDIPISCSRMLNKTCNFFIWDREAYNFTGHCHLANVMTCGKFVESPSFDLYRLDSVPVTLKDEAGMFLTD